MKSASWPKNKNRLGRSILLISVKAGARNLADDQRISASNIGNREYHHVFPVGYLEDKNYDDVKIDTALNCALIHWKDNRNASNKPPLEYIKDRIDADEVGEQEIQRRLDSHYISIEDLEGSYEDFLDARAERIKENIELLCEGKAIKGA